MVTITVLFLQFISLKMIGSQFSRFWGVLPTSPVGYFAGKQVLYVANFFLIKKKKTFDLVYILKYSIDLLRLKCQSNDSRCYCSSSWTTRESISAISVTFRCNLWITSRDDMINVDPKFALWPTNRDINIYVICRSKGPHRESLPEVLSRYLGPRARVQRKSFLQLAIRASWS